MPPFLLNLLKSGLSDLFGATVSSGLGSVFQRLSNSSLTGAQREANKFNAEHAQKQMDFQKMMSNTAFQRQVNDMRAAGVNPALMYGGAGSSGSSGATGSSANSVSPTSFDPFAMLSSLSSLKSADAQKTSAEASLKNAETNADLANSQKSQLQAVTNNLNAQNDLIRANIDKILSEKSSIDLSNEYQSVLNEFIRDRENASLRLLSLQSDVYDAEVKKINQMVSNLGTEQLKMLQDIKESYSRISLNLSSQNLNSSKTLESLKELEVMDKQIQVLSQNSALTEKDVKNYVWNLVFRGIGAVSSAASVLR